MSYHVCLFLLSNTPSTHTITYHIHNINILLTYIDTEWRSFCGDRVIYSNYIVLAYAAWYKPGFMSPYNSSIYTYKENQMIGMYIQQ